MTGKGAQNKFESAVVSSFSESRLLKEGDRPRVLAEDFARLLAELGREMKALGAFIGHLKAMLDFSPGGSLGLSLVKDEVGLKGELEDVPSRELQIAFTAIIYGLEKGILDKLIKDKLGSFLPGQRKEPASNGASGKPQIPMW